MPRYVMFQPTQGFEFEIEAAPGRKRPIVLYLHGRRVSSTRTDRMTADAGT